MTDPYATLGAAPSATHDELRRAYLALARANHPDYGGDPARMRALNEAWALLGDPVRRRRFDQSRLAGAGPSPRVFAPEPDHLHDDDDDLDLDDLAPFDAAGFEPARRPSLELVPAGLFAGSVTVGCLALALDEPGMFGPALFLFFMSCIAVAAVTMLSLRRSARAARR